MRFTTPSYADTLRAHEALHTYAFPGRRNLGYLFAFESKRVEVMASIVVEENGQKKITVPPTMRRFEALVEFQRQLGLPSWDAPELSTKPWTVYTKLNANYQLCFSYPNVLLGPATLPESSPDAVRMLTQCAGFRSEQRMPALTWANPIDGASLWRSSQPKIGIQGNRSMADEMVLKHIMDAAARANASRPPLPPIDATQLQLLTGSMDLKDWTVSTDTNNLKCALKILDLRPRSAAMANRTSGKEEKRRNRKWCCRRFIAPTNTHDDDHHGQAMDMRTLPTIPVPRFSSATLVTFMQCATVIKNLPRCATTQVHRMFNGMRWWKIPSGWLRSELF